LARLEKFFKLPPTKRAQRKYNFILHSHVADSISQALRQLFGGQCAYCESANERGMFSHFRPLENAVGLDGKAEPDCYGWLAYEWENLYPVCGLCQRAKGSRFPIQDSRARIGEKGKALLKEQPLLLDPCYDNPDEHLFFEEDGRVAGLTERSNLTIEILTLNRAQLAEYAVAGRQALADNEAWLRQLQLLP
jgi:uncharacterized protein (TIGR02646 family)